MNKLKEDIFTVVDKVNQNWVEEFNMSKKEKREFNMYEVMSRYSKLSFDLNRSFLEHEQRKSKGFFR